MKYFVTVFLFALVAGIRSEYFEDLVLNDGEIPPRHPYFQCKIDLYDCMFHDDTKGWWTCTKEYVTCMKQLIPPRPQSVQCTIDLYYCFKENQVGNFECTSRFGSCLNKELPSFIQACNKEVAQCWSSASDYNIAAKFKCCTSFAYCFLNGPTPAPSIAALKVEDASQMQNVSGGIQCKKDLRGCLRTGEDKNVCFKKYKACMYALVPPYVKQCYAKAKECLANTSGFKKYKCVRDLAICLKNGAPTTAPPKPSAS
ncbi:uncharacterized protein [Porites lutea]|uniref:uncharacterized protein n=1 Tax=Porites lutea TaxID=51062 RepID=UPI003CC57201